MALIAGGGRGIGQATTQILSAAGAAVAIIDNVPERAEAVAQLVVESGGKAVPIVADLFDEEQCQSAVDGVVAELGGLDVLANVAGGMNADWVPMRAWSTETWDTIIHLNLRYVFWMCRAAIPVMEARGGGSIVNVTSISGVFGSPNHSAYGAAKAGLIHLTKTIALECGRSGIRANAVSPGAALTPAAIEKVPEDVREEQIKAGVAMLSRTTPLQRPGSPEDIARGILFFASPIAEYVTGQMLLVDGGVSAKFPLSALGADASAANVPAG